MTVINLQYIAYELQRRDYAVRQLYGDDRIGNVTVIPMEDLDEKTEYVANNSLS